MATQPRPTVNEQARTKRSQATPVGTADTAMMTRPVDSAAARPASLDALTGLRFVAAFAVLLFHYQALFLPPPALASVINYGLAGVSLFFILSGFILTYNYYPTFSKNLHAFAQFYRARIARVYPIYLLSLIVAMIVVLVIIDSMPSKSGSSPDFLISSWLANAFTVQSWLPIQFQTIWNSPAWSVGDELLFYLIFPLFIFGIVGRLRSCRALIFSTATLYVIEVVVFLGIYALLFHTASDASSAQARSEVVLYRWPISRVWEFLIGAALGRLFLIQHRNGIRSTSGTGFPFVGTLLLTGGIFLVFVISAYTGSAKHAFLIHSLKWYVLYTPAFCLFVYALARYHTIYSYALKTRIFLRLGDASYSLYLIHIIPFTVLLHLQNQNHPFGRGVVFCTILGCVIVSLLCHRFVEAPARRWLRGGNGRRAPIRAAALPGNAHPVTSHAAGLLASVVGVAAIAAVFVACSDPLPGVTVLLAPATGALEVQALPTLRWAEAAGSVSGRTRYRVVISDGQTGQWVATESTRSLAYTPPAPLLPGHQYFWGVVACGRNVCGPAGPASSFWTASAVPSPQLSLPAEGQGGVRPQAVFRWLPVAADGPVEYRLSVYDGVTSRPVVAKSTTETAYMLDSSTELKAGRRYYWAVQACVAGACGSPARAWGFDTAP